MSSPSLLLEDQLCFRFYTVVRLITRLYQPHLDRLGLNTNTLTPLLKRLEAAGFVTRTRGTVDSRQVILCLTPQAKALREEAEDIPSLFSCKLRDAGCAEGELSALREQLDHLIPLLETLTQTAGV